MQCSKCGSTNVNVQMVSKIKKKHSWVYWLLIGWWLEPILFLFLTLPYLLVKIFKPNKYKTKTIKTAVCQNCGHSWKI